MQSDVSKFGFIDCSQVYKEYDKLYHKHKRGRVILGPPVIGKTTFVNNQKGEKHNWIDQDTLYEELNVQWHYNEDNSRNYILNNMRADYITEQSKLLGYKLIGSLFWQYVPDAIVIIPLELHNEYLKSRPDLTYRKVMEIRSFLQQHAKTYNIPVFDNIEDAVKFVDNLK